MRRAQGKSWERTRSEMVNYPLDTSNTPCADRPLVTFALFAYNQEKYIREAIEGAFAQTYQPLEIILSDDCSKDRTFEIMEEMAQEYRGPHQIVLNRNPSNLGIAGHVNTLMELCRTDFVIVAAGDDISLPERTDRLVEVWLTGNGWIKSVHSPALCIDGYSNDLGICRTGTLHGENPTVDQFVRDGYWVLGATNAWDRSLFSRFGPILSGVGHEDDVIALRSLLDGGVGYVSKPLVRYRIDSGVRHAVRQHIASTSARRNPVPALRGRYRMYIQMCTDISRAGGYYRSLLLLKRRRARALLACRLAENRRLSRVRIEFFMRRASYKLLIWELLRYRAPNLFAHLYRVRKLLPRQMS